MTMLEAFRHFVELSQEIKDYSDRLFKHYIFTWNIKNKQFCHCTHCNREFDSTYVQIRSEGAFTKSLKLKHNSFAVCPHCNTSCIVKNSAFGRSQMIDYVYYTYYEKSVIDPQNVIVARGIYAVRDYTGDFRKVKTRFAEDTMYVFSMFGSSMYSRYVYYYERDRKFSNRSFVECKKVHSIIPEFRARTKTHTVSFCMDSIRNAVEGTPFQYSTWEKYKDTYKVYDFVEFFDLFSKYPCIEHIAKAGFEKMVIAKLLDGYTYGAVNWRAKTIFKALRVNRAELKELKYWGNVDLFFLKLYQTSKKDGSKLTLGEINDVKRLFDSTQLKDVQLIMRYSSLRKAYNYILMQYKNNDGNHSFYSHNEVIINWRDYINDCISLEMNLQDKSVLYPKSLYTAHQNTIKQVKVKADEILDKKFKARAMALQKYCFEYGDLFMRPAENTTELISEGKALKHCVGTYANSYASGSTAILFIRKKSEPEKPYFTVEIMPDGYISQVRGKSNCDPREDVKEFIEVFKKQKLKSKSA